ncbi:MAG: MmgE/PrpD family protein [Chloroflexota bacterium]
MNESRRLAQFAAETRYEDLPNEVIEAIRIYILDDLAAGCAGARTPWSDMVADLARETSHGPCTVFGRDWTTSPAYAALANGVMVGGFEVDHPFTPGSCHPSGAVFPAALAIAERERASGKAFLTAVATGYELLCRVGLAATRAVEDERGFHGPGTNAAFGAAAASGNLLGMDAEAILHALGIAGSHGGGLVEFFREGAMTKRLHLGRGAQMGVECALLAQRGFTGPSTVLEGSHGFLHAYSPAPKLERLLDGLGERWELMAMVLKAYPCHISFHAVIDGLHELRRAQHIEPSDIQQLRITSATRMMEERFTDRQPTTLMGAQYSLPWSAALALCQDASDPQTWVHLDLNDPAVARIAQMAELVEHTELFGNPRQPVAEVSVTANGLTYTFTVSDWKGAPSNPYTFDEISEKFRRYASFLLPPERIEDVINRVSHLEDQRDISELACALRQ